MLPCNSYRPSRSIKAGIWCFLVFIVVLIVIFCQSPPLEPSGHCLLLQEIPGPEDMVLDAWSIRPRLLVSSQDRRNRHAPGEIYSVDLSTDTVAALPREKEPENLSFHPHGLDLARSDDGKMRLYAVSHRREGNGAPHAIAVYEVRPDRLVFERIREDILLTSPNDVVARQDGSFYVSNDRSGKYGILESLLRLKRSTVVYCDGSGKWSNVARGLAMANGLAILPGKLVVAATREDVVYSFTIGPDGSLTRKEIVARVKGPDNVTIAGGDLLVASHGNALALALHSMWSWKKSPSIIYRIYPPSRLVEPIFSDDGSTISAASVGVQYKDSLYVGQIFDHFVLKCRCPDGKLRTSGHHQ